MQMQERSILQNTPRSCGMKTAIILSINIENQETSRIGNCSKEQSNPPKDCFFDIKIQEVANKSQGPWELMNWVNKYKLPVMEAIKYNNNPCLSLNSLWTVLHSSFNTALHRQVDINILDEIRNKQVATWALFSKEEFKIAINSCNNLFTPWSGQIVMESHQIYSQTQ